MIIILRKLKLKDEVKFLSKQPGVFNFAEGLGNKIPLKINVSFCWKASVNYAAINC